ncbi:MAG: LysM peptidoglycan-binding domain-containing protein [Treponema sp.]|nr:LysM peptidoglycan-binding domain-containing protein [Spirochaetales bacterium]MDY6190920.1 LysM peptidoglycan-binding domain-containing protein [Treponema sp.]
MRTIGIKLADGSFYPVLEEFSNSEKQLDLTTAHNNQTKIMVDLYRSKNCSMEDAEYVDSLQIENLVAHPNGEPDISFSVSIDENNKLSAKIKDSETGNQSKTTITLVSRTIEERLTTDEYKISDSTEKPKTKKHGFLAKAEKIRENDKDSKKTESEKVMPESEKTDIPDFDEQTGQIENKKQTEHENNTIIAFTPAADDEINRQKKLDSIDDVIIPEDESQKNIIWPDDTDVTQIIEDEIPEENLKDTETAQETEVTENTNDIENPEEMQIVQEIELNETPEEKVDFNDVIEPQEETETENETSEEISEKQDYEVQDIGNDEIPDDTGLPELNFDFPGDDSKEVLENAEKDFNQTDSEMPEDFFDIDNSLEEKDSNNEIETNIEENPFDHSFDDFDNDFESASENNVYTEASSSAKGPLSFTGLYDKETELGLSEQDEKITKKTKGPVIICIICAIICVIATLLILFIVPSKYNLLHKGNSQKEKTEITEITVEDQPQIEPEPEIAEPIAPQAQEEEVVVVEQAEIVVPEQPPVTTEKPKDINYKIKWGDTLWDIADTYYKNPWRYKYIAKFNHIKDPDYIISGTYITIPAE